MAATAQILVLDNEGGPQNPISTALSVLGFDCVAVDNTTALDPSVSDYKHPQAIIVNGASGRVMNDNAPNQFNVREGLVALARLAKTAHIPLILLARSEEEASDASAAAAWDDVLVGAVSPGHLARRIAALARLGTMQTELARRMETAARYGIDAPPEISRPVRIDDAAILVLGQGKYYAAIETTLSRYATLTGAFTVDTALEYLQRREFDAIIVEIQDNQDEALLFVEDVRRHPRFFNIPILAIGSGIDRSWMDRAYESGCAEIFTNPDLSDDIRQRVMNLIQEGRYRETLRSVYQKARHMATSDSLTGLYSRGFLFEHLKTMIEEAGNTADAFTVVTFRIRDMPGLNDAFGYATGDRMIRQVGEIMGLLLRGEDLTARYSGAIFAAILPDTTPEEAEAAILRVVSVIRYTEFSVPEIDGPVQVDITSGIAGNRPGEDVQALVSRSLSWIQA